MGQDSSHHRVTKTYQIVYHAPLNLYSQAYVVLSQNNTKYIQYQLATPNKQSCKRWEKQLTQYYSNVQTTLLYLPLRYYYKKTEICGSAGILDIIYEYYPITLKKWIQIKKIKTSTVSKFSEPEIWRILFTICCAANNLHERNKKIGKIGLESVFINNEQNQMRIGTGLTFYSDSSTDQIYAPESLSISSHGMHKQNPKLQQAFCIGILVLCSMLLIQKIQTNQIASKPAQVLQNLLQKLRIQNFYSKKLQEIVKRMCNLDPNHRITPTLIVSHLQNYQNQIWEGKLLPLQVLDQILKQNDQSLSSRPSRLLRVTLGSPDKQKSQKIAQSYSKILHNSLQKTDSLYVNPRKQITTEAKVEKISDLLDMVDRQLQKSRQSFPS